MECEVRCPYFIALDPIAKAEDEIPRNAEETNHQEKDDGDFFFDTDCGVITCEQDSSQSSDSIQDDNEGINENHNHNSHHQIGQNSPSLKSDDTDCPQIGSGCQWIGKYKSLNDHIDNECAFVPIQDQLQRIKTKMNKLQQPRRVSTESSSFKGSW